MNKKGGKSRRCLAVREWSLKIKERDKYKCRNCGEKENLEAHHIIPWNQDEKRRLDLDNGITYCKSCHHSIEKKGREPWIKGKKHTKKARLKMSKAKKGKNPWNKGIKSPLAEKRKCRDCKLEKLISEFTPMLRGRWYTNRCKLCRNKMLKEKRNITVA